MFFHELLVQPCDRQMSMHMPLLEFLNLFTFPFMYVLMYF